MVEAEGGAAGGGALFSEGAKQAIAKLVGEIEKKTCAEIVVALRPRSGDYRATDLGFGVVLAVILLCVFLYHPEEFDFTLLPLEQVATLIAGAVFCNFFAPLRRLLTRRKRLEENVARAARSAFIEQRVDNTTRRTGILIYLSTFEQRAFLVIDRGIDRDALKTPIEECEAALSSALKGSTSLAVFTAGIERFGAALAKAHPITEDDVDELSNEVAA